MPASRTVLEFEIQDAHRMLPPETWARGVRHAIDRKGYGFRRWEISNEPYVGDPAAAPVHARHATPSTSRR